MAGKARKVICEKHKDRHIILTADGKVCFDCEEDRVNKAMLNMARDAASVSEDQVLRNANARQVGGDHYQNEIQHWDFVASHNMDYFQGQITKYVTRWKKKGGVKDLEKARHFLDKYIEIHSRPK